MNRPTPPLGNCNRFLAALVLLFWVPLTMAQADIKFQHLSRQGGLSQAFVLSVTQDRDGYMWFGTQSGLNRFDGYSVRVFEMSGDQGGLPDSMIRALFSDSEGRLWVGTDNGGLALYQPESETFKTYDSGNSGLPIDRIRVIHEDSRGKILIGTDGAGLWQFQTETDSFVPVEGAEILADRAIWDLSHSSGGHLLVATKSGLFERARDANLLREAQSQSKLGQLLANQHVRTILHSRNGQVWLGTESLGLLKVDESGEFTQFRYGAEAMGLVGQQVFSLLEDDRGDVWVATSGGLNRFHDGNQFAYTSNSDEPRSLSSNVVLNLYQDRGGVIWVATYGGVNYWSRSEYIAEHVFTREGTEAGSNQISSNGVTSFAESQDGTIWVGTFDSGLNKIGLDGSVEHIKLGGRLGLPDDSVMSVFVDSQDRLWVGTRSSGLVQLDSSKGVLRSFNLDSPAPFQLSANAVTSITESKFGQLLVGTYGGGFNQIDLATFAVTKFEAGIAPGELPSNRIMAVHEDSGGDIWLATDGSGVVHYDRYRDEFSQYNNGSAGFSSDLVLAIAEDQEGTMWFGSADNGMFRLAPEHRGVGDFQFERISIEQGLPSNSVYGLKIDAGGNVWSSSNAGVSRLDAEKGFVQKLGLGNGLQDLEFNSGAALRLANGDLLFGGVNGFNRLTPSDVEYNSHSPRTVITGISKQGESLAVAKTSLTGLDILHQDYFVEFQFAGLDYSNAEGNQYRYRLLGLQDDWVSAGTRRYVSYNSLPPGDYVFEVQASNSNGIWSTASAKIDIRVSPAPWFSVWAYLAYGLFVTLVLVAIYRGFLTRQKHVAKVQAMNEQLRREIEVRKETESQIRVERSKSQRYIDVAEVMLVSLDVEGIVLNVNEKGSRLLAADSDSLVGCCILDFIGVQQRNEMRQKILAVFDAEDNGDHLECQVKGPDGTLHTIIWRFAPLSESAGHASLILASGTDITELRQLEKAVRFNEKLSALGTLSAGIAHDFNNILTAITGYNDLALGLVDDKSEVKKFLRRVEQASNRATELVARILSVTQLDEGSMVPVDLVAVLKESVGLLRGSLPAGIEIEEHYPEQPLAVEADIALIHQLVVNLGTNAFHAMERGGGHLGISLESKTFETNLPKGSNMVAGDYAVLHFRDTGMGMPDAMKQKIFDPFYSFDNFGIGHRAGAGLGLSIVHGIVLSHKGHVEVESRLGMGSDFTIFLPLGRASLTSSVVSLPPPRANKRRIMLVDDEDWITDVTTRLLVSLGHEVEAFLHPLEALERFKSAPNDFEVVITDQNMPHMKGTELLSNLRRIREDIKVVVMSGNVSPLAEGDEASFMSKPFRLIDLKTALAKLGIGDGEGKVVPHKHSK